jgi:hypothetical protein
MNESNEKAVTAKPTSSDVVKAILSEQFSPLSWSQQMDLQEQEITPIATQKSTRYPGRRQIQTRRFSHQMYFLP